MSARDLERLDHTADDFADDHELRGEAGTSEQDTPVAKTPSHRGMTGTPEASAADTPAAGALAKIRPTSGAGEPPERARVAARVARDERRARQALSETRGRVAVSTIDPPRRGVA